MDVKLPQGVKPVINPTVIVADPNKPLSEIMRDVGYTSSGVRTGDPAQVAAAIEQEVVQQVQQVAAPAAVASIATPVPSPSVQRPGMNPRQAYSIELPNGLHVTVQEPNGNIIMRALRIIPPFLAANMVLLSNIQTLLYIVSYQWPGKPIIPVGNVSSYKEIEDLSDVIDTEGLMYLNITLPQLYQPSAAFLAARDANAAEQERLQKEAKNL